MNPGKLYLIPSLIAVPAPQGFLSPFNLQIISKLDEFIVEELRTARRFLRSVGYLKDFNSVHFYELNEHTDPNLIVKYLEPIIHGKNVGLISEAGTPCVADPGSDLVMLAHQKNINVIPLSGPNSVILALMSSGLNGQSFTFHGYLPIDKNERNKAIRTLDNDARSTQRTQIFIETPYRNLNLFDTILKIGSSELKLCIACNINSADEFIRTMTIREWKIIRPDIHKKPTVFLLNY
jgi:16S rRNA (cytidine1402-2'-O)-methyltransferase